MNSCVRIVLHSNCRMAEHFPERFEKVGVTSRVPWEVGGGVEYPNLSVYTCMFMENQLCNYAPIMALVINCVCHSHIGALRHSMPIISMYNKWNANFSLIHGFQLSLICTETS